MMRTILDISVDQVVPSGRDVLAAQGIPDLPSTHVRYERLLNEAVALYRLLARPSGIIMEIPSADFAGIYEGEGRNEKVTPLLQAYPASDALALFAVTVGEDLGREISQRFAQNDFALGSMLDTAASEGAERAAACAEAAFARRVADEAGRDPDLGVLRFSPGYCGWHINGQKKLFAALRPEEIGITLTSQFLMVPLKSVSGVIVIGPKRIFAFEQNFTFCAECEAHSCRDRVKSAME